MTGVRFSVTGTDANEEVVIETDRVIIAFGFTASPADWFEKAGIKINDKGLLKTLPTTSHELPYLQQTSATGIFAGGDMVRGADLVVTAIAEGRQAAREILSSFDISAI